jgi:hypothetical protein
MAEIPCPPLPIAFCPMHHTDRPLRRLVHFKLCALAFTPTYNFNPHRHGAQGGRFSSHSKLISRRPRQIIGPFYPIKRASPHARMKVQWPFPSRSPPTRAISRVPDIFLKNEYQQPTLFNRLHLQSSLRLGPRQFLQRNHALCESVDCEVALPLFSTR